MKFTPEVLNNGKHKIFLLTSVTNIYLMTFIVKNLFILFMDYAPKHTAGIKCRRLFQKKLKNIWDKNLLINILVLNCMEH